MQICSRYEGKKSKPSEAFESSESELDALLKEFCVFSLRMEES